MGITIEVNKKSKGLTVAEPESVSALQNGHYGVMRSGVIHLSPEEALYLMDIRNAKCYDEKGNELLFNDLARHLYSKKLMARYFTYKDWKDRGLMVRPVEEAKGNYGKNPMKKYPSGKFTSPKYSIEGVLFPDDLVTIIDDESVGRELYENYWFGQFGSYKAEQRGKLSKLDIYETLFMLKHCGLHLKNSNERKIRRYVKGLRSDLPYLYEVYEDWRLRGFILKTGFKFGTHFRVYFPKASPTKTGEDWVHSRHVIHVFPRRNRMLISEWARAIRVAHSVRKTFILAIPGAKRKAKAKLDFLLYHRKNGGVETPGKDDPTFVMLSLSEEEHIGGGELAEAIEAAKKLGLDLILAISDRETSVTYYRVRRIELPGSRYEYYEIEWEQP